MLQPCSIALIGYGGIARVHALAYRSIPFQYGLPFDTVRIAAVVNRSAESAARSAREAQADSWTTDYREVLQREDIHAVDICTPNNTHAEIILAAAAAGKHIFCEKPLSLTVAEGRQVAAAVEQAGVKAQLNFNFRYFPAITRARQLIEQGFLGRVFSFRGCFYRSSYINPEKPLSWRLRKDVSGGGALFDLGSHILDLIYYLLGDYEAVSASLETLIKDRPIAAGATERAPVDVDDLALLQVRMANGALGSVEVSRMGTGATNDLTIEIYGQQGALRFSATDPSWLEVFDARDPDTPTGGMSGVRRVQTVGRYAGQKAPDWSMAPGFLGTFVESQYSFLRAISAHTPTIPNIRDGLHVQQVMEAALRSSETGAWVLLAQIV